MCFYLSGDPPETTYRAKHFFNSSSKKCWNKKIEVMPQHLSFLQIKDFKRFLIILYNIVMNYKNYILGSWMSVAEGLKQLTSKKHLYYHTWSSFFKFMNL